MMNNLFLGALFEIEEIMPDGRIIVKQRVFVNDDDAESNNLDLYDDDIKVVLSIPIDWALKYESHTPIYRMLKILTDNVDSINTISDIKELFIDDEPGNIDWLVELGYIQIVCH